MTGAAAPCSSAISASALAYCRPADFNSDSPAGFSQSRQPAPLAPAESAASPAAIPRNLLRAWQRAPSTQFARYVPQLRFPLSQQWQFFRRLISQVLGCVGLPPQHLSPLPRAVRGLLFPVAPGAAPHLSVC